MELLKILERYPFLRPTLALLLGLWIGNSFNSTFIVVAIMLSLMILLGVILKWRAPYKFRWVYGFTWLLLVASVGVLLSPRCLFLPTNLPIKEYAFLGVVENQVTTSKGDTRMVIRVMSSIPNDSVWSDKRLTVTLSEMNNYQKPGMLVAFKSIVYPIFPLNNPGSFDYNRYLNSQGIYGSVRIKSLLVVDSVAIHLPYYKHFALKVSSWLKARFITMGFKGDELGVMLAMLDGDREFLTPELKQKYQQTGTIHILAVSGLHVGVIVEMLLFMFGWLDRFRLKLAKVTIILVLIWLYAIVANLEPSIVRATLMFSILLFSREFGRSARLENSLFLSAFVILLIMPCSIYHAGFWLSYLAVGSIILFSKRIGDLFATEHLLLNKAGQIISVTLAAQIITMPCIFYLFGTFSTYFLISNLVILPIVPIIMFGGIGISFLSIFITPYSILVDGVSWIVFYMNWMVDAIQKLPFAQIEVGRFSFTEMMLWYMLLALFLFWLTSRRAIYIFTFQSTAILLLIFNFTRSIILQSTNEMVVFAKSDMLIACKSGDKLQLLGFSRNSKSDYYIDPYVRMWPQDHLKLDTLRYSRGILCIFSGKGFGIVTDISDIESGIDNWRYKPQFIYNQKSNKLIVSNADSQIEDLKRDDYSIWPLMRCGSYVY